MIDRRYVVLRCCRLRYGRPSCRSFCLGVGAQDLKLGHSQRPKSRLSIWLVDYDSNYLLKNQHQANSAVLYSTPGGGDYGGPRSLHLNLPSRKLHLYGTHNNLPPGEVGVFLFPLHFKPDFQVVRQNTRWAQHHLGGRASRSIQFTPWEGPHHPRQLALPVWVWVPPVGLPSGRVLFYFLWMPLLLLMKVGERGC